MKTCTHCGREFWGHFNAKFCGNECRVEHKRKYERAYFLSHKKEPPAPPEIPPFPPDIDREAFGPWVSGFADGEATFLLRSIITKDRPRPNYAAFFRISLRDDDTETLQLIQSFLRCGTMHFSDNARSNVANAKPITIYSIQCVADLAGTVIPHFERYPLRSKKRNDFEIWRQGVGLMSEVQSRPNVGRNGKGGSFPKWTGADRERFLSLSDQLVKVRYYAAPLDMTPPRYS